MERWRRLRTNTGLGGVLQTGFAGVFLTLTGAMASADGIPFALPAWLVGLAVPFALRRWLVADPELWSAALRVLGMGLMGTAFAAGLLRGRLWAEGHPLEAPGLVVLLGVAGLYVSAFFWLFSDPDVVRMEHDPDR